MDFLIALKVVVTMVLCMLPGYALVKAKAINQDNLSGFAAVLLYICQPCIVYYTFKDLSLSRELAEDFGMVFAISMLIMTAILMAGYLIFRKRYVDADFRIATVAFAFANCSFFGVPLLEAAMPGCSAAIAYTSVYGLAMNILGWTVATAIITRDRKYISIKKALFNPVVIACVVVFTLLTLDLKLPSDVDNMLCIMGRMATPISMMLVGMRLASMEWKMIFLRKRQYVFVAVKQLLIPLATFLFLKFTISNALMRSALFVIFCCPCASVVSNFAEVLGDGQETAANLVILGTILSIVTIPLMLLVCGI